MDPMQLLESGASRAQLLRWGALTDMLGYYLLLIPLFVCVGSELRQRAGPIVDLLTVGGVLYAGIGATAAVVLAEAGPLLLGAYDQADPAARDGIALAFRVLTDTVYKGAWQTLEVLPLAVWTGGTGVLLWGRRRLLGSIGITLGVLGLLSAVVRMTQVEVGTGAGVGVAALVGGLFAAYMVWLALLLLRQAPL
jgi:hypothetical protein